MARIPLFLVAVVLMPGAALGTAPMVNLSLNVTQPGVTNPVCVRAIILQSDGTYLDDAWFPTTYPQVVMHGKAMAPGVSVSVPAGVTSITVGKGPDYLPQTITTNLGGSSCTINVTLQPVFDLYEKGWRSAEMHLHYIHGEKEILRLPPQVWAICAAGGYNLVSFCEEHYGAGKMTRQQMYDQWVPYQSTECQLYMGLEEPKNAWGHQANILHDPWLIRSSLPYWLGIHSVHEQGGVSFPVHPPRLFPQRFYTDPGSGFTTWFLYPWNNFSKCYPLDSLIGHLTDAWSGVSDAANTPLVLPPYFKLLSLGYRIPLLADSDLCMDRINNGGKGSGCWLTYYNLEGRPLTPASVAEAIHRGRVMSTTGPLVAFTIDNAISGDTLPADGAAHTVSIQASYTFNPWTLTNSTFSTAPDITRITEIDLYRNGQILQSWTPNTPTASVQRTINESAPNSYYMVRVVGNEGQWMAGYASPIYFDNTPRPRQPPGFKALIQGRLYDSASGLALTGTVSCVRYAKTNWTIPTDSQGRFQVYAPLDAELIAQDNAGRTFSQNVLQQESVYAFCNYMADNYGTNMEASVAALSNIVQQMSWEFPIGYQLSASYVRTNLAGDAAMSNFSISNAPPFTSGKTNSEIAMLLVDKTQVQPGDTINYAVIFRSPQQPPVNQLGVEFRGWDTNHPQIFTKYNLEFWDDHDPATLTYLGNGFYVRQSSVVVPPWVANVTSNTAAFMMYVTVRTSAIVEDAQVLLRVGPTQRALLVSSTWDGFPASWGEIGVGPCNFRRDYIDFLVRYSDYRNLIVNLSLSGQSMTLNPKADTAHVADADDAVFSEQFYYDGQCEPQYRNVPYRDPVRTQPPPTDFSTVPIVNPPDTTPPNVVAIEPAQGASMPAGTNLFYFLVDDEGLSGPASATLYIDGTSVANSSTNPFVASVTPGTHTWQVKGYDVAGNSAFSPSISFTATGSSGITNTNSPAPGNIAGSFSNGLWDVQLNNPASNWFYILQRTTNLQDWTPLSSNTTAGDSMLLLQDSNPPASSAFYRILIQPP